MYHVHFVYCLDYIYLVCALLLVWIVLEKMALLMVMVGLKMFSGGTPGLDTIMAWFPKPFCDINFSTTEASHLIQWRGGRGLRRRSRPWPGSRACWWSPPGGDRSRGSKASLSQQGSVFCEAQFLKRTFPISTSLLYSALTLREPLVLKAVESVEEALVKKVGCSRENLNREEGEDLALEEEDDLHHDGEHCVRYHHRYREVHQRPALGGSEMCYRF